MTNTTTQYLALASLHASPTNPRTRFEGIDELAESIKVHGVLQPLIVRQKNGSADAFEIVAGERRYRAAKKAKVDPVPVHVHKLTDAQVLEIQVIENLQRADLHPLEEAVGFHTLLEGGKSYAQIASVTGKSKAYVAARMALRNLSPKAIKLFDGGKMVLGCASQLARLRSHKLQDELIKARPYILDNAENAARECRRYTYDLKAAPFPVKAADLGAVPCAECPKRSGNDKDLFGDLTDDVCTDPGCFDAKRTTYVDKLAATAEAAGQMFVRAANPITRKLFPYSTAKPRGENGLVDLDADDNDGKTFRSKWGKSIDPKLLVMVENPHDGKIHACVDITNPEIKKLLPETKRVKQGKLTSAEPSQESQQRKKAMRETAFRKDVFAALVEKHKGPLALDDFRVIATTLLNRSDTNNMRHLGPVWFPDEREKSGNKVIDIHAESRKLMKMIDSMKADDLGRLLLQLVVVSEISAPTWSNNKAETLTAVATRHKIDVAEIRKTHVALWKEKDAARQPKAEAKPKVAKAKGTAAKPAKAAKAAKKA